VRGRQPKEEKKSKRTAALMRVRDIWSRKSTLEEVGLLYCQLFEVGTAPMKGLVYCSTARYLDSETYFGGIWFIVVPLDIWVQKST
jgi:hypothetical protein